MQRGVACVTYTLYDTSQPGLRVRVAASVGNVRYERVSRSTT